MSPSRYDDQENRSHLMVIAFVVFAVLALGYHFRHGLWSLLDDRSGEVRSVIQPVPSTEKEGLEALFRERVEPAPAQSASLPTENGCRAPADSVETRAQDEPIRIGLYLALRDTRVRSTSTRNADTVAFLYEGQRLMVLGGRGDYVEIHSIRKTHRNPPGYVLREDVVFLG